MIYVLILPENNQNPLPTGASSNRRPKNDFPRLCFLVFLLSILEDDFDDLLALSLTTSVPAFFEVYTLVFAGMFRFAFSIVFAMFPHVTVKYMMQH